MHKLLKHYSLDFDFIIYSLVRYTLSECDIGRICHLRCIVHPEDLLGDCPNLYQRACDPPPYITRELQQEKYLMLLLVISPDFDFFVCVFHCFECDII